jgi:fido (protein-threonine AMPylation protein)
VALTGSPSPGPGDIGVAAPSPHLAALLADADRLVARCADTAPADLAAGSAARGRAAALASLRLDGSPITAAPDPDTIGAARTTVDAATIEDPRRGTWFDAMRAFEGIDPDDLAAVAADASIQALEFDGVATALAADDLAPALLEEPVAALAELHRRLTRHLVSPERVGQLRLAEQAVHDASVGRIMYFTVAPERIAGELDRLAHWLTSAGPREHGLVVSGTVHLELLRIHPFDAANGRLARAAARLLLRARGLDPAGVAAFEPVLDADRLGYHDEVARTFRRRDRTIWLERWGEAVTAGLRTSARSLGLLETSPPPRSVPFLAERRAGEAFTVADHRSETGLDPQASDRELRGLLDAGVVTRVPGSRGLRYRIS